MAEGDYIEIGGAGQIEETIALLTERRESGPPKKSNIDRALEDFRKPQDKERDPLREGNILVQAAIGDEQERDTYFVDEKKIGALRSIDSALLEITYGNGSGLDAQTMELVANYFRRERDQWDRLRNNSDKSVAEGNRDIYAGILSEIYDKLPLPEAAIGEAPEYIFDDIDRLTGLMGQSKEQDQDEPLSAVVQVFETIQEDVTQKVDISKQADVLDQALKYAQQHMDNPGYEKLVGILNKDGKVEFSLFEEGKNYNPTTEDGKRQFIIDLNGSYSEETNRFALLKTSAEQAVNGVKKLLEGKKIDDLEEKRSIFTILALLEKNEDIGSLDGDTYIETVKEFGQLIRTKLEGTDTGDDTTVDEVVQEEDGDKEPGDIGKTRQFMQNGRRLRKRYYI
jgi:hypothetical protein